MFGECSVLELEEVIENPDSLDRVVVIFGLQQEGSEVEVHEVDIVAAKKGGNPLALFIVNLIGPGAAQPRGRDASPPSTITVTGLEGGEVHQLVITDP